AGGEGGERPRGGSGPRGRGGGAGGLGGGGSSGGASAIVCSMAASEAAFGGSRRGSLVGSDAVPGSPRGSGWGGLISRTCTAGIGPGSGGGTRHWPVRRSNR